MRECMMNEWANGCMSEREGREERERGKWVSGWSEEWGEWGEPYASNSEKKYWQKKTKKNAYKIF